MNDGNQCGISSPAWEPSTLSSSAFSESGDPVHLSLCKDPAGVYPLMEFETRASYRRVIEQIAGKTMMMERDVAELAVELASKSLSSHPDDEHLAHVGYYLIDAGRAKLEESVGYQPSASERFTRAVMRRPAIWCFGLLSFLTALTLSLFLLYAFQAGASALTLTGVAALLVIPSSEFALRALDAIFIFRPHSLPKMDFAGGVPEELRTMVVVPTIFSSPSAIQELLETIEAHYLANQDDHIFFALLGDWSDAAQEKTPNDDALLNIAIEGITELNARHHRGAQDRFYLFHRRRQWNQSEEKWMGWERKRGKLREFNRLLRGANDTSFIVCTADRGFLAGVRYVITLDSDTQLPCDVARRLIGAISHPLNRPKLNASTGRVERGYVIIQPRIGNLPTCVSRSRIPRIFSNSFRANPGAKAVADIYQNLLGEGTYLGKGLYDVDAFETVLKDSVPENSLLSHDHFESFYARAASAMDIELFESRRLFYEESIKRRRRWIRGDWQLLPWLMPYVRNAHGRVVRNDLPKIALWKIFDNLRRSMTPLALLLSLSAAWIALPGSPVSWTLLALLVSTLSIGLPTIKLNLLRLSGKIPRDSLWSKVKHIAKFTVEQVLSSAGDALFFIIILAHQVHLTSDAILRTLYRVFVSRKRLLEWTTAAQAQEESRHDLRAFLRLMWPAIMIALAIGALILINRPAAFTIAAPFLIAWLCSPLIICWNNHQARKSNKAFESLVERAIRLDGRRAWKDLESLISKEPQCVSSGAYRNAPQSVAAGRAISTNLLRLPLWTEAAYELGCVGFIELLERLELAFTRIVTLQGYCGNHRNGGDTMVIEPLTTQRIVAVENGNPAGYLATLKWALIDITNRPLFDDRSLKGLSDTISLLKREISRVGGEEAMKGSVALRQLREGVGACAELLQAQEREKPETFKAWGKLFSSLADQAAILNNRLELLSHEHNAGSGELCVWAGALSHQTREFNRDLRMLAPWTSICVASLDAISKSDATVLGEWTRIMETLDRLHPVSRLPEVYNAALSDLLAMRSRIVQRARATGGGHRGVLSEFDLLLSALEKAVEFSTNLLLRYSQVAAQSETIMKVMNFHSLFDEERKVVWMSEQSA